MLKMDLNQIIDKIKQNSGLSIEEINSKIEDKLKQLSGLISREGAAHIVANDLGIKLFDKVSGKLQVKNILSGMRNVETVCKVQRIYEVREFQKNDKSGRVLSMMIGDETGLIRLVLWNDAVDKAAGLNEGDTVRVSNAYVRENNGRKEIHIGEKGVLEVNPVGEKIGDIKQQSELAVTRKGINDLVENDSGVEILGTIVNIFDLRFYEVCPTCGKRSRMEDAGYKCPVHGIVTPDYAYLLNFVIDDGVGNIRAVCFRNQVQSLIKQDHNQILGYRENSEKFDDVKHELLGKMVKLQGRVTKNAMFDRVEFVSMKVFPDPNPEEEIKRLEGS
ncbi:MAG: OB-fold nucleic acid binding domain-containing protein [Nanoarchaeota archaeon]|nr:OB-fold nucleic acid binding domain-containing protein [Nanoarchaeota archaeon]